MTQATSTVSPRVATLLPFPLTDKGGINTFVRSLTEALARDFEVTQLVVASDTFSARSGRPLAQLSVAARHVLAMLRLKPDIVHTHEHPALLAAAIVYRVLAARRVRLVHTIHVHPFRPRNRWKRLTLGWMLRRCSSVTVVARATADCLDMVATPVPENVRVIHGAARMRSRDATDVLPATLKRSLRLGDGPTLCQISPLNLAGKVAGVGCLLQATALVRQHRPDVQLLLVGGGELRLEVESLARRTGVAECTYLTDYLDDVSVALALTDVYCQITHQDACPLSLLEAMCVGKPVIASRVGGIPELVTDGVDGTLVSNDPEEIARQVLELLIDSPRAQELGRQAAATVQARFNWQRVACEFAAVYGLERRAWRRWDASPPSAANGLTRESDYTSSAERP